MKKLTFLSIVIFLSLQSCIIDGWDQGISGNGNVLEETRDISGFTGVKVSSGIDVYLSQGNSFEVRVEADENLQEVIVTEKEGNILIVKTERVSIRNAKSKKVHVTLPDLKEIKISSAGDLRLEVDAQRIDLDISSSGDADIDGTADEFNVSLSSAGDLNAFDLIAANVDVDVSSAGNASVHATDEISMNASSAGNINYRGDARVIHSQSSSAGNISHRD